MTWHRRPSTLTRARKAAVLRAHGHRCHWCGHEGATQVDHLLNVARGGTDDPLNLAPIHGTPSGALPCPWCRRACHFEKTQFEAGLARASRVRIPERHPGVIE